MAISCHAGVTLCSAGGRAALTLVRRLMIELRSAGVLDRAKLDHVVQTAIDDLEPGKITMDEAKQLILQIGRDVDAVPPPGA